jgi:hypothetical protein
MPLQDSLEIIWKKKSILIFIINMRLRKSLTKGIGWRKLNIWTILRCWFNHIGLT